MVLELWLRSGIALLRCIEEEERWKGQPAARVGVSPDTSKTYLLSRTLLLLFLL
jgi:hypothetical protein